MYLHREYYHNVAEGSTLKPFVEIFVDGVSLGKKEVLNSKDNVDYNDVDGLFLKSYSSGLCTFYFDDMSYTEKRRLILKKVNDSPKLK